MDLRQMGHPYEKKYIEFTEEDRNIVTQKFKVWRLEDQTETYRNQDGFCYSATKEEVVENDYCLTPSRYIAFDEDNEENGDVDFDLQMKQLQRELKELMAKEQETKEALMKVMEGLGYGIS